MEIGPIKDGKLFVEEQKERRNQSHQAEKTEQRQDDVSISAESQNQLQADKAGEPIETDQRLDRIRERIDSGFYEQTAVKEKTIDKLMDQMLENINQFYR